MIQISASAAHEMFAPLYARDDFEGFGYLGARRNEIVLPGGVERVAAADVALLEAIAELVGAIDTEFVFAFSNSKLGRWYADDVFGGYPGQPFRYVTEFAGLLLQAYPRATR